MVTQGGLGVDSGLSTVADLRLGLDAAEVEYYFPRMSDHIMINCTYDLGDDLLKVIGQIVVSFGQLEHIVAMTIKRTSPSMTLAEAVALTDGIVERSTRAQESFERWAMDQNLESDFRQRIEEVSRLARRRNDVIHALWGRDTEGRVRWQRSGKNIGIEINRLRLLRDEIRLLAAAITEATRPDLVTIEIPDDSG